MIRLKLLRSERVMSQKELGEKLTLSQQSIHKYETGQAEPDINTLIKIADIFHTSVDYLIGHDSIYLNHDFNKISNVERMILETFRNSSPELRKSLCILFEKLSTSENINNAAEDPEKNEEL